MIEVIRKTDRCEALRLEQDGIEEIMGFINYDNSYPLMNGDQLVIRSGSFARTDEMYANAGDWIVKRNGRIEDVVNDERFRERYVAI